MDWIDILDAAQARWRVTGQGGSGVAVLAVPPRHVPPHYVQDGEQAIREALAYNVKKFRGRRGWWLRTRNLFAAMAATVVKPGPVFVRIASPDSRLGPVLNRDLLRRFVLAPAVRMREERVGVWISPDEEAPVLFGSATRDWCSVVMPMMSHVAAHGCLVLEDR